MSLPTPPRQPDSVPVLNSTPLPAFTQSWQLQPPRDAQILIVKGTFDLVPDAPATPAEEHALPLGPEVFDGAEEALRYPGDMAFFKPRCDVLVTGFAYPANSGAPVRQLDLRFGEHLSYEVAAIGDRVWDRGAPSIPKRFEQIEIRPERAFGGPEDAHNPIGVGRHAGEGTPLPNFERPEALIRTPRDRPRAALLTAVPQTWPERLAHVGDYGGDWVSKRAPYFPDSFRFDYFQCAPRELQVPYPRGDEWYRLSGFRPSEEVLQGRLPGLRMRGFAQRLDRPESLVELPLNLDLVWFDPQQLQVVLTWRGALEASDQFGSDLASLFVLAEPIGVPCARDEVERRFIEAYATTYEAAPEEEEPPVVSEVGPPDGYVAPVGLTPAVAAQLGLPAFAATVPGPTLQPKAPAAPGPALPAGELAGCLDSNESLAGRDLSYCDLKGRDLAGRDFTDAVLVGADLSGADLRGARFIRAVLSEARLDGGVADAVDFTGATLTGASMSGMRLDQAKLNDAVLDTVMAPDASWLEADLSGASVVESDLSRAKMAGAVMVATDLSDSKLVEADLTGANLEDVRMYGVVAPQARFDDAKMMRCRIDGAQLMGASLARVDATDSSMRQCDFSDCDLSESKMPESVLEDARLDRANFNQVDARECRWPRAKASDATFVKANLMRGYFEGAEFAGCDLRGANLYEAETFRARFTGCQLEHAILGESGIGR